MRGKWFQRIRTLHTWLGVFFSPLLLLFIITGWWQTFVTEDTADKGAFNRFLGRFSTIHTDDYFAHGHGHHHASRHFQFMVALMAIALITTILLGLMLSLQSAKNRMAAAIAFALGILIPVLILYFN